MGKISIGTAAAIGGLGYAVVFLGLILLMVVVTIVGKIMAKKTAPVETPVAAPAVKNVELAPGTAGEVKLYDVSDRDAAMIMAIVADKMGRPLNELRFKSIKEVK